MWTYISTTVFTIEFPLCETRKSFLSYLSCHNNQYQLNATINPDFFGAKITQPHILTSHFAFYMIIKYFSFLKHVRIHKYTDSNKMWWVYLPISAIRRLNTKYFTFTPFSFLYKVLLKKNITRSIQQSFRLWINKHNGKINKTIFEKCQRSETPTSFFSK